MFLVSEVMEMAKFSSLANLPVAKNETALIGFINLGVSELYRRFNLSIKVETIITNPDLALYELRNKDISLLLGVYNSRGEELRQTDVLNGSNDYKIINFRSFLLQDPKDDLLFAVYKASSSKLTAITDKIDLPDSMMDALLTYIAYIGHSTINKDNINESSAYARRFSDACDELDNQGYRISINNESISLRLRGYI